MYGYWDGEEVVPSLTCRIIQAFGGPKSLQWGGMIRRIIHLYFTLIQYGTMVFNLWFKEHNICFNSFIVQQTYRTCCDGHIALAATDISHCCDRHIAFAVTDISHLLRHCEDSGDIKRLHYV